MRYSFSRMLVGLVLVFAGFDIVTIANANTMHISENGTGQVLLFPYYTARSGNVSLMSLVNTTTQGKAVRVTVREARGGFVVAQFNLYMSAKDVWTGAIVSDSDGAQFVSSDTSCTSPAFAVNPNFAPPPNGPTSLPFSADTYRLDNAAFISRDRTREGYIEVIEMASIPNATRTGVAITHVSGVAPCLIRNPTLTLFSSVTYEPPAADLVAPIGGLMGSMSFVNVAKGMLASAPPTVIENFWLTGQDAPALRVAPANSATIDLTSGKNTSVAFAATSWTESATTNAVERYTARFATSIDAVSALLSNSAVYTEYAHTDDQVISTLIMYTMPTKPYYIRSGSPGPFAALWDSSQAKSCDRINIGHYTRDEVTISFFAESLHPPAPASLVCSVANPLLSSGPIAEGYGLTPLPDTTYLSSALTVGFGGVQNNATPVPKPGKEGGWAEMYWNNSSGNLQPVEAAVYRRNPAGALVWEPIKATLLGLPVIGFTLSQAAYQTGSPQQNFADAIPLRSQTVVYTVP